MRKVQTVDAETLLSTPLPPVRWMIPELLPAGLTLLAGASKAGKSWLCLWLCLQLAKGGKLWGRLVQPRPVLYLCLEDTYARIQKRLFQLTEDPVPGRLYFQTSSDPIGQGLEQQLETFLATHPDTGLVFIDTLQKVRVADQGKGVYATDYQDMAALKSMADRHNIALLLKQGVPMKQIQEWLGHSDISTTANIYAHLDSQSKQLSAATMEQALPLPEELPENRW